MPGSYTRSPPSSDDGRRCLSFHFRWGWRQTLHTHTHSERRHLFELGFVAVTAAASPALQTPAAARRQRQYIASDDASCKSLGARVLLVRRCVCE